MKRLFWAAIGVALISMVFANCKKEEPTYSVQVTAAQGGTVEGQSGEYKEGETVVFTAVPADGYYFTKWSDGNTDNPRTITVFTSNISITAKFIGISATDGGTVETQKEGVTFVLTAIPADGYFFCQWSDGNINNPRTITVSTVDIAITAEFGLATIETEFGLATIETVDLGLTSGNHWTTCNVGAINHWNYGNYYAWGETQTKDNYCWETYKYWEGYDKLTKYNCDATRGTVDDKTTLESVDDVATIVYGKNYSMPTLADWKELINECYWVWTSNYNNHSVSGYIVYRAKSDADKGAIIKANGTPSESYSLPDAHIFLPAAGHCFEGSLNEVNEYGYYWSASLFTHNPSGALSLYFESLDVFPEFDGPREDGYSIRPVKRP